MRYFEVPLSAQTAYAELAEQSNYRDAQMRLVGTRGGIPHGAWHATNKSCNLTLRVVASWLGR
jgi:hypothetical protein